MCHVLAKEMDISILQWNNDESILLDTTTNFLRKSSVVKSFEEFLSSSINGFYELDTDLNNNSSRSIDKENS